MKSKLACALLTLLIFQSLARDPFFPPHASRCRYATNTESGWHLLGVIGRSGNYEAWLATSAGQTLRRKTGDHLPGTLWRITRIDAHSTTLTAFQDCQPAQRLALKGPYDAQDPLPMDGGY